MVARSGISGWGVGEIGEGIQKVKKYNKLDCVTVKNFFSLKEL